MYYLTTFFPIKAGFKIDLIRYKTYNVRIT